jgi:hypothetical protein
MPDKIEDIKIKGQEKKEEEKAVQQSFSQPDP